MTIGEKIQYCRKNRLGISQAQLAEKTGINITTIKLYENNKMIPSSPQAQKLANAFGIGVGVFTEPVSGWNFKLETYGDLIKLIMVFRKNHIISINGDRGKDGKLIPNTVTFSLAPAFGMFFQTSDLRCSAEDIQLSLKSNTILDNLLKWESLFTKYEDLSAKYKNDEDAKTILKGIEDDLDVIELEMQFNSILLERTNGHITVKVNPDYGNEDVLAKAREKAIAKELKSQKAKKRRKNDDDKK